MKRVREVATGDGKLVPEEKTRRGASLGQVEKRGKTRVKQCWRQRKGMCVGKRGAMGADRCAEKRASG